MKDEILDLLKRKTEKDEVFADAYDLYEHLNYDGSIHEIVESNIDIYYYDLRKWAVDNYGYIEEAMENGFAEEVKDFHALIQTGQYFALDREAIEIIAELYSEYDGVLFNADISRDILDSNL